MDGFLLDDGALSHHGTVLDGLGARMRTAAAAGTPLGPDAYGVVGQIFATGAVDAAAGMCTCIDHLAEAAEAIGNRIRDTLHDYQAAEARIASNFRTGIASVDPAATGVDGKPRALYHPNPEPEGER
jgi:hypothetical protein